MSIRECTIETGFNSYLVKYELASEESRADIDPYDFCGKNEPDVTTWVIGVHILDVRKNGCKISADDAVYGAIKEIIESDQRTVSCDHCR